jgi:tetratricopeptide (TPR) repeat protein
MKSLGTITMYFDFVDTETRSSLESIMKKAYNYSDFVKMLSDRVCFENAPRLLAFMAVHHSSKLWNMNCLIPLSKKYAADSLMRPYFLDIRSGLGEVVDWQGVLDSTRVVLNSNPDHWLALLMHLLNYRVAIGSHQAPLRVRTLKTIEDLILNNEELSCFSYDLWILREASWRRVEDQDKRLSCTLKALEMARKYDDKYSEGYGIRTLAAISYSSNLQKTQELLHSANTIFEKLGHKLGLAENLESLSGVYQTKGEYSKALECLYDSMKLKESLGADNWLTPTNVAWIYNIIGDYLAALEWSEYAILSICMCDNLIGYPHLQRSRALINVGRTGDALEHLDIALQYALREGDERLMKLYDLTLILLQRAEGDTTSALLNLERCMDTDYPTLSIFDMNEYLLLLAETEVIAFNPDMGNFLSENSGPWMERFEERAREEGLSGILGLALPLKAKLRLKQGRKDEVYELLGEVLKLGQKPSMKFLEERALNLRELVDHIGS